jgi:hypothetical protein
MRQFIVLLAISIAITPCHAAEPDQREYRLAVRHYDGFVDLRPGTIVVDPKTGTTARDSKALQTDLSYQLRSTDSIIVIIEQTNPLLFTYAWKDETPVDTSDFASAKKFADSIKALSDLLSPFGPSEKTQSGQGSLLFEQIPYCTAVEQLAARVPHESVLCKAGVDLDFITTLAGQVDTLHSRASSIPQKIKDSATNWDSALKVRNTVVNEWSEPADLVKTIRLRFRKLHEANRALLKAAAIIHSGAPVQIASIGNAGAVMIVDAGAEPLALIAQQGSHGTGNIPTPGAPAKAPAAQTPPAITLTADQMNLILGEPGYRQLLTLIDDEKSVDTDADAYETFVERARKIGDPVVLKTVKYSATQTQPAVLTIGKVPVENVDVSKYKTGDFKIAFNPGGPVKYDYGLAAVYSFLEVPQFGAKKGTDDKLHIARTDNGDAVSGTTGAAMLTITPRRWNDPQFGAGFQLGISPVKDKAGIFLGGRIRVFELFTFGAGIAYQQTKRLARGQALDDIVESADKIKTTNAFKPAAYVSIGIDLTKK